jgi:uncharacterized protein YndB with AHSA1/START domain
MLPRSTGETRHAGYQIGVRRTLPLPAEHAWDLVTSPRGLRIWLGRLGGRRLKAGLSFRLADGTHCRHRVLKPGSSLRLGWHPPDWPRSSTIQVRVIPRGERCVLAFHQEGLPGASARLERGAFYRSALVQLQELAERLASPRSR